MSTSEVQAWPRTKISYLISEFGGSTPSKQRPEFWRGTIPWVSPKDMKVECIRDSIDHVTDQALVETGLRMIPTGSVLMVVRGMILAHTVPVALTEAPVSLNQDMKALVPGPWVSGLFLRYCLQAHQAPLLALVEQAGHGTRCLRSELWRKLEFALPPLPIQKAIADFLDRKTAAIDALVEKKQRLLKLLAEKRAALINQAVTRGLDPGVPMKDSGVAWIGEVPAHWEVKRLKHLAQVRGGITKGQKHDGHETTVLPYLRVANVQDGFLDLVDIRDIEVRVSDVERFRLHQGDILMNEGGDNDKLGRGAVWESKIDHCLHQNHVFAVRPQATVDPYWVNLTTQATYLKHFFYRRANQSTNLASISASNLKEAPVLWPPAQEQEVIKSWLLEKLDWVTVATSKTERHIELMTEYRQALITAAVTGQLDIPEEAA